MAENSEPECRALSIYGHHHDRTFDCNLDCKQRDRNVTTDENISPFDNNLFDESRLSVEPDLGSLLVVLLKGVLYEDADPGRWSHLLNLKNQVKDYVRVLGLDLVQDDAEGYAFLRTRTDHVDASDGEKNVGIPRLISRRQLSFPVSLLLALLRKKLAEFDASGEETRLVLMRDDIVELMRLFHPDSTNEARLVDQIERHINKVVELGFLRKLKPTTSGAQPGYEVRRIIKAFVDGQWLAEFDAKLDEYQHYLADKDKDSE